MNPRDLIRIARRLASGAVGGNRGRPRQTELCRAVSAVYYALFHSLALSAANTLAGSTPASRSGPAWRRTYRALEHRNAKNQCSNSAAMSQFPPEIQAFGKVFVLLQDQRHYADYDPAASFRRAPVLQLIDEAEDAIIGLDTASVAVRRAFAIHILLRSRRG